MSVEVAIVCDKCSAHLAAGKTAAQARKDVVEMGGTVALPGGRDLCPTCASQQEADAASPETE